MATSSTTMYTPIATMHGTEEGGIDLTTRLAYDMMAAHAARENATREEAYAKEFHSGARGEAGRDLPIAKQFPQIQQRSAVAARQWNAAKEAMLAHLAHRGLDPQSTGVSTPTGSVFRQAKAKVDAWSVDLPLSTREQELQAANKLLKIEVAQLKEELEKRDDRRRKAWL